MEIITITGCQFTVKRTSVWLYPAPTVPARSVEVGGAEQVLVPPYVPEGNSFGVGIRFVPINAENKDALNTSNLSTWPKKIKRAMKKRGEVDLSETRRP